MTVELQTSLQSRRIKSHIQYLRVTPPGCIVRHLQYLLDVVSAGIPGVLFVKYIKDFELPGAFTLRLWAKAKTFPGSTPLAGLGQYTTGVIIRTDTVFVNNVTIPSSGLPGHMSLDTWTHVAVTRDSSNLVTLWIGKTAIASQTISGTVDCDHM